MNLTGMKSSLLPLLLFDKFNLKETELPFNIALQHGISTVQFRDTCLSLHRKEVISIFDDKAVKFENQNLRDYLLYYAFFKEKWLSPCDLICQAFPTYKNRVVFAFNTLVRLFNSQRILRSSRERSEQRGRR